MPETPNPDDTITVREIILFVFIMVALIGYDVWATTTGIISTYDDEYGRLFVPVMGIVVYLMVFRISLFTRLLDGALKKIGLKSDE